MDFTTIIILLSIGLSGLVWAFYRNHPKVVWFNEKVLTPIGLNPYVNPMARKEENND